MYKRQVHIGGHVGAAVDENVVGDQAAIQTAARPLGIHAQVGAATADDVVDDHLAHAGGRQGVVVLVAQHQAAAGAIVGGVPLAPEFPIIGAQDHVALHHGVGGAVDVEVGVVVVVRDVVFQGDGSGEAPGHQPFAIIVVDDVAAGRAVGDEDEDDGAAADGVAADVEVAVTIEPGGGQVVRKRVIGDLVAVEEKRPRVGHGVIGNEVFVAERLPAQRQVFGEAHQLAAVGRAVEGVDVGRCRQAHGRRRPLQGERPGGDDVGGADGRRREAHQVAGANRLRHAIHSHLCLLYTSRCV